MNKLRLNINRRRR